MTQRCWKKEDDEAVLPCIAAGIENWTSSFHSDQQLCHLASGLVATEEQKEHLSNAHKRALKTLRTIAEERHGGGWNQRLLCRSTPILKTFSSKGKKNRECEATQAHALELAEDYQRLVSSPPDNSPNQ